MGDELHGAGKYSVYRQIRQARTYRTLGRMSWQRTALGLALLASVFFISGAVSEFFAARGHFVTARRLMLSPAWVERYRPELGRYIEGGALLEEAGDGEALAAYRALGFSEDALTMASAAALRMAKERLDAGEADAAFLAAVSVDPARLDAEQQASYRALLTALLERYKPLTDGKAQARVEKLESLLGEQAS